MLSIQNFSTDNESFFYRIHHTVREMYPLWVKYSFFDSGVYDESEWMQIISTFIVKGDNEKPKTHQKRCILGARNWSPLSTLAINKLSGVIFAVKPDRVIESEVVQQYVNDENRSDGYSSTVERSFFLSKLYGSCFTLVRVNASESASYEGQAITPFPRIFKPLNLINYELDITGNPEWVLFRDEVHINGRCMFRWYKITKTEISTYILSKDKDGEEDPALEGTYIHKYGKVPVICDYGVRKFCWGIGASYIEASAGLDIQLFSYAADLTFNIWGHAHNILVWTRKDGDINVSQDTDGASGAGRSIGTVSTTEGGIELMAGESMEYLQFPNGATEAIRTAMQDTIGQISKHLSMDPIDFVQSTMMSKVTTSGVSRSIEYAKSFEALASKMADAAERYETQFLQLLHQVMDHTRIENITVSYGEDWSLNAPDTKLKNYKESYAFVPSRTYHIESLISITKDQLGGRAEVNKQVEKELRAFFNKLTDEELIQRYSALSPQQLAQATRNVGLEIQAENKAESVPEPTDTIM